MRYLAGGLTMAVLAVGLALTAPAAHAQRVVDLSGTTVANGSIIRGGPSTATLTTNVGKISCASRFAATVINPAILSVTTLSWASCTETIPLFNVCAVWTDGLPGTPIGATVTTATATGGTVALNNTNVTVQLCPFGGPVCKYGAAITGTAVNNTNTLQVSQSVPRLAGSHGTCPASGTFAVYLTPVWVDLNNNGVKDGVEPSVRILP